MNIVLATKQYVTDDRFRLRLFEAVAQETRRVLQELEDKEVKASASGRMTSSVVVSTSATLHFLSLPAERHSLRRRRNLPRHAAHLRAPVAVVALEYTTNSLRVLLRLRRRRKGFESRRKHCSPVNAALPDASLISEEHDVLPAIVEMVQKVEDDPERLADGCRLLPLRLGHAAIEEPATLGNPVRCSPGLLHEVLGIDVERVIELTSPAGLLERFHVGKQIRLPRLRSVGPESSQVEVLPRDGVQPGRRQQIDSVHQHVANVLCRSERMAARILSRSSALCRLGATVISDAPIGNTPRSTPRLPGMGPEAGAR